MGIAMDFFGETVNIEYAKNFLENFPAKNAIILTGPPGAGKTYLTVYIGEKLGYKVITFNASDERTKESVVRMKSVALNPIGSKMFMVLDECEGMDKKYLLMLLKVTKIPIFMCCNFIEQVDFEVRKLCNEIKMVKPTWWFLQDYMKSLCKKYDITIDPKDLEKRARKAKSFRHAERLVDDPDDEDPEQDLNPFVMVEDILRGRSVRDIDMQPKDLNLWMFDTTGNDKKCSDIDIVLGRIHNTDYHQWGYAYSALKNMRYPGKIEYLRTPKLMGEVKKERNKVAKNEDSKVDTKVQVDINKMDTQIVETGKSLLGDLNLLADIIGKEDKSKNKQITMEDF